MLVIEIDELLSNKVQENQSLEYKAYNFENGKFNTLDQKHKSTLIKEIWIVTCRKSGH